jgi:outer membrane autotransporter protein
MQTPRKVSRLKTKKRPFVRPLLGSIAALLTAASLAQAGQLWDGGGANGLWSNALNWDADTTPNYANPLEFGGAQQLNSQNDATATVAGITFVAGADNFVLTGNAITLNGGITVNATNAQTVSFDAITLGSNQAFTTPTGRLVVSSDIDFGTNTLTVNATEEAGLSGTLSGSGGLTKTGTGRLVISGNNAYSGNTLLQGGTIVVNGTDLAFGTGTVIISDGTTLASTSNGDIVPNSIQLQGNFTLAASDQGNREFGLTGDIDLGGATRVITGSTLSGRLIMPGVISNGGVTLTHGGASSFSNFIFGNGTANANTYTGLTTVNANVALTLNKGGADGAIQGDLTVNSGGAVNFQLSNQIADTSTVTVNSTGFTAGGSAFAGLELNNQSDTIGVLMGNGSVGLGTGELTVGSGTFSGAIIDGSFGTGGNLTKETAGTLILSGENTYTGTTTINDGTLQIGDGGTTGAIASTSVVTAAGGTLAFNRTDTLVYGGVISGPGAVRQVGTGITSLTGVNTYTGNTIVDAGTLSVTGSLASSTVNVNGGTFIAGNSTALTGTAGVNVAVGGGFEYRAVDNNPLNIGSLTLNSGAGTTIGGSIGSTFTGTRIIVAGDVMPTPGDIRVNVFIVPGVATGASGVYTLLTAGAGSTLNVGTNYTLGAVYNATNFTLGTPMATATELTIQLTQVAPLDAAYWVGGLSGNPNVWAISDGGMTNWASDNTGTPTPLVPGAETDVFFSAGPPATPTDPGDMVLGASMAIGSLTINAPDSPETRDFVLNRSGSDTLTIAKGSGITILNGAGAVTINPDIILGAGQAWTNNSTNVFTVNGNITNGGYNLTVTGTGDTLLDGVNSGSGGLIKNGTGKLTITNNNTYTGNTLLQEGSLFSDISPSAASNKAFGTGQLIITGGTLGSTLNNQVIPNNISAQGNFTLAAGTGGANLILNGNIDLNGGTREISGSTPQGQLNLRGVISNGAVTLTHTGATEYSAFLYGNNSLSDQANTYAGLTTINANVFLVSNKAVFDGAVRGDVLINPGGCYDYFLPNQIADTSTVTVNSNGLTIAGPTTFAGFEMRNNDDTIGALFGNGTVGLGSAVLTVGRGNFSGVILDGEFGNGGILTKNTTGTLVLSGANTFTGNTNINNGTLILDGSVQSPFVFVNFAGTLMGSGFAANNVINAGIFSPGNSPGTFTIGGSFAQNAAGTLVIEVAGTKPGEHDLVKVAGTAELAGSLRITRVDGARLKAGDKVTFLTADAGVKGGFEKVSNDFNTGTILAAGIVYEPNAVSLQVGQGSFAAFADEDGMTPNQHRVATALDRIVSDPKQAKLIDFLNNEPLENLAHDFDLIAPEELQAIFTIGISQANVQTANLQRRMGDIRLGKQGFSAEGLSVSGLQEPTANSDLPPAASSPTDLPPAPGASGPTGPASREIRAPDAERERRYGAFFTGVGEWSKVGTTANASGYDLTTGGFTFGVDYRLNENIAVGINAGYARTSAELYGDGNVTVDGAKLGVYGTYHNEEFYVDASIQGGYNNYDTRRSGLQGSPRGSTNGGEFNALLAIGYDFQSELVPGLSFGPVASLQYTYVGIGGFTENGSLAPLNYDSQGGNSFRSTLGFKGTYDFRLGGVLLRPELRAAWQHEYADNAFGIEAGFANGGGGKFTVTGSEIGNDSLLLGAGVAVLFNERMAAYLYYDGELGRSNFESNNVSGGFRMNF